jgi:hypothetical protein
MLAHTKAYLIWRKHSQQMLDFAVLVCTAAPQLEYALRQHESDPAVFLAKNPAFRPSEVPYSTEKRALPSHTDVLGATLLLSIFSYFETYFFSVIDEIIDFHGGEAGIKDAITRQLQTQSRLPSTNTALKFLRTEFKPNHSDRYRKYSSVVRDEEVIWPSQRLMLFGLREVIRQRRRWRSADIPDLARDLLTLDVSQAERDTFHNVKDRRNSIAHGKALKFDLKKALDTSNFFLRFSRKLEDHVVENFMIIERYVHV